MSPLWDDLPPKTLNNMVILCHFLCMPVRLPKGSNHGRKGQAKQEGTGTKVTEMADIARVSNRCSIKTEVLITGFEPLIYNSPAVPIRGPQNKQTHQQTSFSWLIESKL